MAGSCGQVEWLWCGGSSSRGGWCAGSGLHGCGPELFSSSGVFMVNTQVYRTVVAEARHGGTNSAELTKMRPVSAERTGSIPRLAWALPAHHLLASVNGPGLV